MNTSEAVRRPDEGRPLPTTPTGIAALIKRLSAAGDWREIVRVTDDPEILAVTPRHLLARIVAALELKDDAVVAATIAYCLGHAIEPRLSLAVASRLITWGRPEQGWQLLSVLEPDAGGATLSTLVHRAARKSSDPAISRQAMARFNLLMGRDGAVASVPNDDENEDHTQAQLAPYRFPPSAPGTPLSGRDYRLTILGGDRVEPRHVVANQRLMAKFCAAIEARPAPKVVEYHDVLVNWLGQIWRRDGTVIRSCNRPLQIPPPADADATVEDAVLCTNATRGFYHWYAERLPSLAWRLAPGVPDLPIIFGSHAAGFQRETMRLLGIDQSALRFAGSALHCRRVYLASMSLAGMADWSRFAPVYDRIADAAAQEAPTLTLPKMIYISRRDSDRRLMTNEAELEARLAALGVVPLVFTELRLAEQIHIIRNADVVIGAHGAGMTHIVNARPGLSVLEIMPTQDGYHPLRFNYARISRLRGHRHTLWLEAINPITRIWTADIPGIIATLEGIIAERAHAS